MYAVIRVRGPVKVAADINYSFKLLGLNSVNHLNLLKETKSAKGLLNKVKDYSTFGEIDEKTLAMLLKKRARLAGNKRLTSDYLKSKKINSFEELAKSLIEGKTQLQKIGIKKVFRLGPPKKGYERKGIKKSYNVGGVLGYRANDINALIKKMV